jgi:hypothetical protein
MNSQDAIPSLELQPPALGQLNVTGDRVRLTILPPLGSFDSFVVRCPNNESFTSNTSVVLNIECSFVKDTPLMSFVLETVKVGFEPAVTHVTQESKHHPHRFAHPPDIDFSSSACSIYLLVRCAPTHCERSSSTTDQSRQYLRIFADILPE